MHRERELDPPAPGNSQPAGCPPLEPEVELSLDLGAAKQAADEAVPVGGAELEREAVDPREYERVDPRESVGEAPVRLQLQAEGGVGRRGRQQSSAAEHAEG